MRLLCIAVGIVNAVVCLFGSQLTRLIWIAGFVILCHVLYDLVQGYEQDRVQEQARKQAYDEAANFYDSLCGEDERQSL
jgi:hypothetical protein